MMSVTNSLNWRLNPYRAQTYLLLTIGQVCLRNNSTNYVFYIAIIIPCMMCVDVSSKTKNITFDTIIR